MFPTQGHSPDGTWDTCACVQGTVTTRVRIRADTSSALNKQRHPPFTSMKVFSEIILPLFDTKSRFVQIPLKWDPLRTTFRYRYQCEVSARNCIRRCMLPPKDGRALIWECPVHYRSKRTPKWSCTAVPATKYKKLAQQILNEESD